MASLGAVEAINLDGGGSTTMAVDPVGEAPLGLVNTPADGFQRSVNTTLLVISTAAQPGPVVPAVTPPILRLSPGMSAGKDDAAVDISWQASDGDGEIVATELERRLSTGTWQAVTLPAANATSVNRRLKFKKDYQYRVRVTDDAGYQSEWAIGRIYRINAVNERATAITRTGKWPVVSATSAIGGNFGRSNAKKGTGQSATLSYSAVQVAWIAPSGAKGGTATVSLDGTPSGSVSLASPSSRARVVQFVGPALDETTLAIAPSRTIRLTNVSTLIRPYVDLDAFLLLTVR
jgi:hypothetical protein